MGQLTTHILNTAQGCPAVGVGIELYQADRLLKQAVTNADGRCDEPLLAGDECIPGEYEIRFYIGEYFRNLGITLSEPPFIDVVPIRFGIAADEHYHVPLLVSPYSYSTYRGS